ncbi:M23 family metallopeptidase [Gemmiger sp.]
MLENSGADTMGDLVDYLCYCSQNNISLAISPEDEEKLYANQVLPDNGAGLSTRYAHMTQTAVTAGEAVTAGQVIGYVGNPGDSTGNHLHFEVVQNGVRVNPMDMVSVR